MHSCIIPKTLILFSIINIARSADIPAQNAALTRQADTLDVSVVAITPKNDPTAAQSLAPSLSSLTAAISSAAAGDTPSGTTNSGPKVDFNPSPGGYAVVESYGLFANTIEELMYDFSEQDDNLIGVFGLQGDVYAQLGPFNTAFHNYAAYISASLTDATDRIIVGYNTANTTVGIQNATVTYAP